MVLADEQQVGDVDRRHALCLEAPRLVVDAALLLPVTSPVADLDPIEPHMPAVEPVKVDNQSFQ